MVTVVNWPRGSEVVSHVGWFGVANELSDYTAPVNNTACGGGSGGDFGWCSHRAVSGEVSVIDGPPSL